MASDRVRPCVNLGDQSEIYAVSNEGLTLIFFDNAYTENERNLKRSILMGEVAFTGISPLIMRKTLVIDRRTAPRYEWHWGMGYSVWIQEKFVCTRGKPPVYELLRQNYREPFF